ncbi:hypothetical protein [Alicyclobacillus acidoterrestris]|uniref:Uncharacterized protein n=1 Tax=Alicyclobacillus acidoterrestris (strain ATCC 49025 / DSM 3922 / CIP 106132 / NCIMB 13137 / GD3B) TaxID=1356854 RepID=T0DDC5_ALIAG|nr:hypothetical protein [Alicyclobacillus acidoterrestris]EPZ47651.1 hypothetical protein N007_05180 [Alicyclobacillus acidoterrestris ATCC 49025]UNO48030.1 hypothetical protein K1I37_15255 [Alicyclobacillus acidoterrestris]
MSDIKATVNIDVSDAISGLKALQRQAKETIHTLKEIESVSGEIMNSSYQQLYYSNLCKVLGVPGDKPVDVRYINKQLYDLIIDSTFSDVVLHYKHFDGATTSALAALLTFDNVYYVTMGINSSVYQFARKHSVSNKVINALAPVIRSSLIRKVYILDNQLDAGSVSDIVHDNDRTITLYGHED